MGKKSDDQSTPNLDQYKAPELESEVRRRRMDALGGCSTAELEAELANRRANLDASRPAPYPDQGPGKFMCVRKCHTQAPDAPAGHYRLFQPGDILNAPEGFPVPRHFRRVDDDQALAAARRAAADEARQELPAFVQAGKQIDVGG